MCPLFPLSSLILLWWSFHVLIVCNTEHKHLQQSFSGNKTWKLYPNYQQEVASLHLYNVVTVLCKFSVSTIVSFFLLLKEIHQPLCSDDSGGGWRHRYWPARQVSVDTSLMSYMVSLGVVLNPFTFNDEYTCHETDVTSKCPWEIGSAIAGKVGRGRSVGSPTGWGQLSCYKKPLVGMFLSSFAPVPQLLGPLFLAFKEFLQSEWVDIGSDCWPLNAH